MNKISAGFFLSLILGLSSLTTQASERACELRSAWGEENVCLIRSSATTPNRRQSIPLHYGTMGTEKLVIEVMRAEAVGEKQMIRFQEQLKLSFWETEGRPNIQLVSEIQGAQLIFDLSAVSSLRYVSILNVQTATEKDLEQTIHDIFGKKAFAVIHGVHKE